MPFAINQDIASLPPWLQGYLKNILEVAEQQRVTPHANFPRGRLADVPAEQAQAHKMAAEIGTYHPSLNNAATYAYGATAQFPEQRERYMNPYQQEVLNRISQQGLKTFKEGIMPELEARFVKLGQHGSSRHRQLAERGAAAIQKEILGQQHEALAKHYREAAEIRNQDLSRALGSSRELQNVALIQQAGRAGDIQALQNIAAQKQAQEQLERDIAYKNFAEQQNRPMTALAQQAALLQGMPIPVAHTQSEWTPSPAQPNAASSLGGAALNLLGARMIGAGGQPRKRGGYIRRKR